MSEKCIICDSTKGLSRVKDKHICRDCRNELKEIFKPVILKCWTCGKEHDASDWRLEDHGVKCKCGGYVVTPSGKVLQKVEEHDEEKTI